MSDERPERRCAADFDGVAEVRASAKTGAVECRDCSGEVSVAVVNVVSLKHFETDRPAPDLCVITKPVTLGKLAKALDALLPGCFGEIPLTSSGRPNLGPCSKDIAVLIVDDVVVNQRVISLKLEQMGITNVRAASSGLEALGVARSVATPFDLILMDAMMPEMTGFEATRHLKADPRYTSVPVVGITGNCDAEGTRMCLESGMVAVLGKPIDTAAMFQLLQRIVGARSPSPPVPLVQDRRDFSQITLGV